MLRSGFCGSTNQWSVGVCPGEVLSSTEVALVQSVALQAMRDAYQGYNVTFTTNKPSAQRHIYVKEKVDPRAAGFSDTSPVGFTWFFSLQSEVYFPALWSTLMSVVGCNNFANCQQTKGLSREQLLTAFGKGMGNTAAHELGHQSPYFFTAHVQTCLDCYDLANAGTQAHFFGPLHWSDFAKNKTKPLVSNK